MRHRHAFRHGSVPIVRPITNMQVYVLDAEMPVGVVGELYYQWVDNSVLLTQSTGARQD